MKTVETDGQSAYELRLAVDVRSALTVLADLPDAFRAAPSDLFPLLPGYWPGEVVVELQAIAQNSARLATMAALQLSKLRSGEGPDPDNGDPIRLVLPVPHPLDADWRFAPQARTMLLERAAETADGVTVLLGTPTLFAHLCGQLDLRDVLLIDRNAVTTSAARRLAGDHRRLRVAQADLSTGEAPAVDASVNVVIADPPWYRPEQLGFLCAAERILRPGGTLLLAAAPAGTRQKSLTDRDELVEDATERGLTLVEEIAGVLPYSSSPFERAAFAVSSLPGVPAGWRRGDLLIFRRNAAPAASRPLGLPADASWTEIAVGRVRVRLRNCGATQAATMRVRPTIPGGVSASVSRRSPERQAANVWTTGNGAWTTDGAGAGDALAASLRGQGPPVVGEPRLRDALDREQTWLERWGWA